MQVVADQPDIEGVVLFELESHPDSRGAFTEIYRRQWISGGQEMVQGNLSRSVPNVLRGLHFHRRQADYWCILRGTAFVGLYDLRRGSPTERKSSEIRITVDEGYRGLYIPKGVAHGFYAETEVWLEYLVDQYYTGEDEFGIAWDDPELGINWPVGDPIMSDRDRSNEPLRDALHDAPSYQE